MPLGGTEAIEAAATVEALLRTMPLINVFIADTDAGILLPITAPVAQQAVAKALVHHPDGIATAVPAEALEGCRPNVLLEEWMRMARR